ncbi:MAG: metallophosphoesterase family protein [Cocleimonas sp.]
METVTIAVISDTHAHLEPQIIEIIRDCDIAVHAGDICGEDILDLMKPKSGKVYAVTGNNDPYCHISKKQLPSVLSFDVCGEIITIEHGHKHGHHSPDHDSLRNTHPDAKIIIYGHTHKQVIDKTTTPWIVNPGAAGKTRTRGGPSCLVIKCNKGDWRIEKFRFSDES